MISTRFVTNNDYFTLSDAKTALFNYAMARRHGGKFSLRLRQPNKNVKKSFEYLGIETQHTIAQHENRAYYETRAIDLMKSGEAYPSYEDNRPSEMVTGYRGTYRHSNSLSMYEKIYNNASKKAIRSKMPSTPCVFDDVVFGPVFYDSILFDDPLLLKDGFPTFNFCQAVDDFDAQVTHVFDSVDNMQDNFLQSLIIFQMGGIPPVYIHYPKITLISGEDLDKHSGKILIDKQIRERLRVLNIKNDSETFNLNFLDFYKSIGVPRSALICYLTSMSWGDRSSNYMPEYFYNYFDYKKMNANSCIFSKTDFYNCSGNQIKNFSTYNVAIDCYNLLKQVNLVKDIIGYQMNSDISYIEKVNKLIGNRLKVYSDIVGYGKVFFVRPEPYKLMIRLTLIDAINKYLKVLKGNGHWTSEQLTRHAKFQAHGGGIGFEEFSIHVKYCIANEPIVFDVYQVMEILGREEVCERINASLKVSGISDSSL